MDKTATLYLVVPCYNEQDVLPETSSRLLKKLTQMIEGAIISPDSRILFVDDGSKDKTWDIISSLHKSSPLIGGLKLSCNRGHQNALLAGLETAAKYADAVISLDADLQDDTEIIDEFIHKYYNGCDIVYGVRRSRKKDSFFKRNFALSFYKLMNLAGVELVYNHADFRLMSRRSVEALLEFKEVNLFLRGMVPLIGFKSDVVEYERDKRFAGQSKYSFSKSFALAWQGITSFSLKPIRLITFLGAFFFLSSLIFLAVLLVLHLCGLAVSTPILFLAIIFTLFGVQLSATGIVGEYVGKIFMEVKARPKYIIEDILL